MPGLTHALALRDVKTKSALGEPFRAELELSDLGDLSDEDIKVSLAQPEDFERLGIEQTFLLAELRFEVVVNREGRSFIKISSPKRVTEPFLDFIIRVTWPNNARLHQVTALLDPPASKLTRKAEPIQAPVVVKAEPVIQPVVKTVEQAIPVVSEPVAMTVTEKSYTVRKFDTLWKIARKVRPNNTVPVAQMMKALHKANPEAFIANNMNLLKDGEVLRVPNLSDVQSAAQVAQQQANTPAVVQAQTTKALARQQIDATKKEKVIANTPTVAKPQMKLLAPT
ncbi:MAG TPA: FimV/HubP family polar landmark protein, partial [Agitococcus sp.]|nr:FimV/HubP family polar landmark protein [Agitococcus sp.]